MHPPGSLEIMKLDSEDVGPSSGRYHPHVPTPAQTWQHPWEPNSTNSFRCEQWYCWNQTKKLWISIMMKWERKVDLCSSQFWKAMVGMNFWYLESFNLWILNKKGTHAFNGWLILYWWRSDLVSIWASVESSIAVRSQEIWVTASGRVLRCDNRKSGIRRKYGPYFGWIWQGDLDSSRWFQISVWYHINFRHNFNDIRIT